MSGSLNTFWRILLIFACVVFSVGLIGYAIAGTTSRYLQDDYCYAAILKGDNFWTKQVNSYLHESTYSGNRFSLTLGMGLSEEAGSGNTAVLPGLMLSAWLAGLYALIRRFPWLNNFGLKRLDAFILAEALALFTLSMASNWVQSFYWRPGMFPYFAPLVTGTFLALLVLCAGQKTKWQPWLLMGVFLLALLTGGFSETAVAVEISLLLIILGITIFVKGTRRSWLVPTVFALMGSVTALALLLFSPVTAVRLQGLYGAASDLKLVIISSLKGSVFFYVATAYRPTLLYASALLFFGLMGLMISFRQERPSLSLKQFVVGLFLAIGVAYILTVASMAPSYYAESSYPGDRALIIPRFVSILLAAAIGFLTGNYVSKFLLHRHLSNIIILAGIAIIFADGMWLAGMSQYFYPPAYPEMRSFLKSHIWFGGILLLASTLFVGIVSWKLKTKVTLAILLIAYLVQPILMGARIFREYPILKQRAALWDWRESQIFIARDGGTDEVTVRALDSLVGIAELSDNPGFWVNNCAAQYYGLKSIRAIEPVLDSVRLEDP